MVMLGDCTLATSYLPLHLKNEARLKEALEHRYPQETFAIVNEGLDGESVAGFLKRYHRTFARHPDPDYVFIRYGVQDRRKYGLDGFRARLHEICDRLLRDFPGVRIVLETGIFVDYPAHYEFDRNTVLQPLYAIIREAGARYGVPVIDIYERMKRETEQGNWDLRVRGYGVVDEEIPVLGAGQDHLHGHDVRWFTNIHPNPTGVAVIADEEARVLAERWPVTLRRQKPVSDLEESRRASLTNRGHAPILTRTVE
jgi:hypothetical protein